MVWSIRPLTIVAAALLASSTAHAADLIPSARTPVSADRWSGPWVGVYGGLGLGSLKNSFSVSGPADELPDPIPATLDAAGGGGMNARGVAGGGEAGWNLRLGESGLVGVEGDIGYGGLRASRSASGMMPVFPNVPYAIDQSYSADWQGAVRLRAGFLLNDFALIFVEGGPAIGSLHYRSAFTDTIPPALTGSGAYNETEAVSLDAVKLGLTLGAGFEIALADHLTLRGEYLYTRFPSVSGSGVSNPLLFRNIPATVAHSSGALNQSVVRLGLNYYLQ